MRCLHPHLRAQENPISVTCNIAKQGDESGRLSSVPYYSWLVRVVVSPCSPTPHLWVSVAPENQPQYKELTDIIIDNEL